MTSLLEHDHTIMLSLRTLKDHREQTDPVRSHGTGGVLVLSQHEGDMMRVDICAC